jgi:serpin B
MPKFNFEWERSFTSVLKALGMHDAFVPDIADFSGMNGNRDLYVSDILHKSFIAVDEKGTEASAATAVIMGTTSLPPSATMTINRPFLFFIYNLDTGAILFSGRVLKP